MSDIDEPAFVAQRSLLRQQLRLQRESLAMQLDPMTASPGAFPRSLSMRLLMQRPDLALRGLTKLLSLLKKS